MERIVRSIYEKAVKAKEGKGEVVHLSRTATVHIDICIQKSFSNKAKSYGKK